MEKVKKIPQRKCIGCAERRDKGDLMRIVRTPEGEIVPDRTGKKNGRGAYLCPSSACLKKAVKSGRLASGLNTEIPQSVLLALEKEIVKREGTE